MSRTLILMRHANQSTLAERDHERPLTEAGRDAAQRVGARLLAEGVVPDLALSSTALRCRQTWQGVREALGRPGEETFDESLYNASPQTLLEGVAGVAESVECLLLIAHNPGISMLALELAGTDEAAQESLRGGFTPGSTARFSVEREWAAVSPRTTRFLHFDPI